MDRIEIGPTIMRCCSQGMGYGAIGYIGAMAVSHYTGLKISPEAAALFTSLQPMIATIIDAAFNVFTDPSTNIHTPEGKACLLGASAAISAFVVYKVGYTLTVPMGFALEAILGATLLTTLKLYAEYGCDRNTYYLDEEALIHSRNIFFPGQSLPISTT